MTKYDVIIIGAGPAGIFAALELVKRNNLKVLILEKGKNIDERVKLLQSKKGDYRNAVNSGWGGAGAFSDGKLTLSTEVGGWLGEYISRDGLQDLIDYVDNIYREFGADSKVHGLDKEKIDEIHRKAELAGLVLIPAKIRHMGTERVRNAMKAMNKFLCSKIEVRTGVEVAQILTKKEKAVGVRTVGGEEIKSDYVIVAPGRIGSDWLSKEAHRLDLRLHMNAVDIGLRLETLASVMEPATKFLYEPKLVYYSKSFDDKVRTFCVCPYGEVTRETYGDVVTVNGQSYANKKTDNTNFAILVSTTFTEPFREPIAYGKYIARLANLLGGGILVQRLGDLKRGRRSTTARITQSTVEATLKDATPGDLSFVLPYRYISDILEMIEAIDKVTPGVNSKNTLLYGVEVKFYSSRLQLGPTLETETKNLYAIGDGAGVTRGLVQSSASGIIAARAILDTLGKN
ncbi:FAD-dependent protein [Candidatus Oleimmundimicrobium sp.]|uniref:NAD(P)/FAD-dependent oxidoreductase n=1 Tax=Candidatus Oleimmundimicrobium sp. TaxID=3060597 RepID=UPI0027159633|nr:NAD(P)/FAD-dependent oxidoreductase [Candidatus Oleimmundimicrobium sp.]MDO8885604.1 FAD-dependent oxidoreductase [Candidatus Oleimmundimicrobium sp.]